MFWRIFVKKVWAHHLHQQQLCWTAEVIRVVTFSFVSESYLLVEHNQLISETGNLSPLFLTLTLSPISDLSLPSTLSVPSIPSIVNLFLPTHTLKWLFFPWYPKISWCVLRPNSSFLSESSHWFHLSHSILASCTRTNLSPIVHHLPLPPTCPP